MGPHTVNQNEHIQHRQVHMATIGRSLWRLEYRRIKEILESFVDGEVTRETEIGFCKRVFRSENGFIAWKITFHFGVS